MTILEKILEVKRAEVAEAKRRPARSARPTDLARVPFAAALHRPAGAPVRVLAEIKRASPSAGPIRPGADPAEIARAYASAGASALSVLTDRSFFDGDLAFLAAAKRACALPVLRKDFLIDPIQIEEAYDRGADAVLLIVAALAPAELAHLLVEAKRALLDALVEAHTIGEAEIALAAGATLLGVNHRDLHTFAIDMTLTEQIARRIPAGTVLVAESGIRTREDVRRLGDAGAHAVLVGEHLMRAALPGDALRDLLA
jgi:indole-3-glycerol phosphate synthase